MFHVCPADAHIVERDGRRFVLIGLEDTWASIQLQDVFDEFAPDLVCVTLCQSRLDALSEQRHWCDLDVATVIRRKRMLLLLASLAFAAFRHRRGLGGETQMSAGLEVAWQQARARELPTLALDRDAQETLDHAWTHLHKWQKGRLLWSLFWGLRRRTPKDADPLTQAHDPFTAAVEALTGRWPVLTKVLVEDRLNMMAGALQHSSAPNTVVFTEPDQVPMLAEALAKEQEYTPSGATAEGPSPWAWLMPLIVLVCLVPVWLLRHQLPLGQMLHVWALVNMFSVALTLALVGARPLSILAGILVSPISIISPVLKASTASSFVEALVRKPRVADAQKLPADLQSVRGIFRNPFSRVLLVFLAASLGSSLGSWIGAWWLASLFI